MNTTTNLLRFLNLLVRFRFLVTNECTSLQQICIQVVVPIADGWLISSGNFAQPVVVFFCKIVSHNSPRLIKDNDAYTLMKIKTGGIYFAPCTSPLPGWWWVVPLLEGSGAHNGLIISDNVGSRSTRRRVTLPSFVRVIIITAPWVSFTPLINCTSSQSTYSHTQVQLANFEIIWNRHHTAWSDLIWFHVLSCSSLHVILPPVASYRAELILVTSPINEPCCLLGGDDDDEDFAFINISIYSYGQSVGRWL